MKQLLVQYTPDELDWSAEPVELQDAPPSVRAVAAPVTSPSLPRFDFDEAEDSLHTELPSAALSPTPLATPVVPHDAWPFEQPAAIATETDAQDESYVGALPQRDPREAVLERHVNFVHALSELESICERFDSVDPSASAAENSLRRRAGALAMVRGALSHLLDLTDAPEYNHVLAEDGAASPYLAGVYLWLGGVTEALISLAHQLNDLTPQWGELRHRLDEVAWIYDMLIAEQMRLDGYLDRNDATLAATFEDIFVAVVSFKVKLAEPFG